MKDLISYRLLRSISFLVFLIAFILFASFLVVSIAPRQVSVRDDELNIIGYASIPHDYGSSGFMILSLLVLSGIQVWTIHYLGNAVARPNGTAEPGAVGNEGHHGAD